MEVILKEDVDRLGKAGAVIKVKDGFARNFLLPNGLAMLVTSGNLKKLEEEKHKKVLESEKSRKSAEELRAKLAALSLTVPVLVQDDGALYGSITAQDIERFLKEEGIEIDKNLIIIENPIKSLGIYELPVKLHPEIFAKIKIWVVKK